MELPTATYVVLVMKLLEARAGPLRGHRLSVLQWLMHAIAIARGASRYQLIGFYLGKGTVTSCLSDCR